MKNVGYILAVLLFMVSCGTTSKRGHKSQEIIEREAALSEVVEEIEEVTFPELSLSDFDAYVDTTYRVEQHPLAYYTEGIKRFAVHKDVEGAIALLERALELDPAFAPAYFEAASELIFVNPAWALEYAEEAYALDSTEVWYASMLGRILLLLNKFDEAEKVYSNLLKLDPKTPENYSMLAALYEYSEQPFTALGVLESAEKVFGKVEELTKYKREILIKLKLYDRAIKEGEEVAIASPYEYENYLVLGQLYAQTNKDSLAIANFNKALKLSPNAIDVLLSMNEYYRITKRDSAYLSTSKKLIINPDVKKEGKVALIEELTREFDFYQRYRFEIGELVVLLYSQYPDDFEVTGLTVLDRVVNGEFEAGLDIFKSKVGSGVGGISLFHEIINMEGYLERSDSVRHYLNMALDYYPNSAELYMRKAWAHINMDNQKKAAKLYRKVIKLAECDSVRSVGYMSLADLYMNDDKLKKSYKLYDKALEYNPDNYLALNNYACTLSENKGDLERALRMTERAVELAPGEPTFLDTYGWVLYRMGEFEEARKILKQAVSLAPKNEPTLLLHYGDVLYELGEEYLASVYWERALEAGADKQEVEERLKRLEAK